MGNPPGKKPKFDQRTGILAVNPIYGRFGGKFVTNRNHDRQFNAINGLAVRNNLVPFMEKRFPAIANLSWQKSGSGVVRDQYTGEFYYAIMEKKQENDASKHMEALEETENTLFTLKLKQTFYGDFACFSCYNCEQTEKDKTPMLCRSPTINRRLLCFEILCPWEHAVKNNQLKNRRTETINSLLKDVQKAVRYLVCKKSVWPMQINPACIFIDCEHSYVNVKLCNNGTWRSLSSPYKPMYVEMCTSKMVAFEPDDYTSPALSIIRRYNRKIQISPTKDISFSLGQIALQYISSETFGRAVRSGFKRYDEIIAAGGDLNDPRVMDWGPYRRVLYAAVQHHKIFEKVLYLSQVFEEHRGDIIKIDFSKPDNFLSMKDLYCSVQELVLEFNNFVRTVIMEGNIEEHNIQ